MRESSGRFTRCILPRHNEQAASGGNDRLVGDDVDDADDNADDAVVVEIME